MTYEDILPSWRAFLILVCVEAILAGVLWVIGLLYPVLLIVLGLLGLCAIFFWDRGARWKVLAIALLGLLAIAGAGYIKAQEGEPIAETNPQVDPLRAPTAKDIKITLIPESVQGENLDAHLSLKNAANVPVTLSVIRYHIPGFFLRSKNSTIEIPAGEVRHVGIFGGGLLKSKKLILQFAYQFENAILLQDGYREFYIPTDVQPRMTLEASECCTRPTPDLALQSLKDLEFVLANRQNGHQVLSNVPEVASDGQPLNFVVGPEHRQLIVNMAAREVAFLVEQGDRQKVLVGQVGKSMEGLHTIDLFWNDQYGQLGMKVDGILAEPLRRPEK